MKDPVDALITTTLENGLKVHLLEDHHTPVVAFQIWVDAGSADESFYTGIAHLFEHMMFKGSKNIPEEVHAQLITERARPARPRHRPGTSFSLSGTRCPVTVCDGHEAPGHE